jgi:hypothetical protein
VPRDVGTGKALPQGADEPGQHRVLRRRVRNVVGALELDPDGEVVAPDAAFPRRFAGVPCPLAAGDELDEPAVAADQEVRRHAQRRDRREIRVRRGVEAVREQPLDGVAAERARRQRNAVDDDQRHGFAGGSRIAVRRAYLPGEARAAGGVDDEPAAPAACAGRGARPAHLMPSRSIR